MMSARCRGRGVQSVASLILPMASFRSVSHGHLVLVQELQEVKVDTEYIGHRDSLLPGTADVYTSIVLIYKHTYAYLYHSISTSNLSLYIYVCTHTQENSRSQCGRIAEVNVDNPSL